MPPVTGDNNVQNLDTELVSFKHFEDKHLFTFYTGISEGPGIDPQSLGIFSGASDSSTCFGVESASKMSTRIFLGVKTAGA
jgi:hypothetical protein